MAIRHSLDAPQNLESLDTYGQKYGPLDGAVKLKKTKKIEFLGAILWTKIVTIGN